MHRLLGLAVIAGFGLLPSAFAAQEVPSGLVITNVTVISPERPAPLRAAWVRVVDGRIAEVSRRPLRGEREIDGTGRYLIPGLIDSHVHLAGPPDGLPSGMTPEQAAAHPAVAAAALAQEPKSYLFFGFTTVVDLNGSADRTARWNGLELRPDAYFCGSAPIANGYPMAYAPDSIRFAASRYFLYDRRQAGRIPASIDPSEHTPEAVIARMAADGAICAKTYYEPGFGAQRGLPTPTVGMVQALVTAAHQRHLPVFVHANSKDAQVFAVSAGADVIAHGMFNGWRPTGDGDLPPDVEQILSEVVAKQIGYQPTIQAGRGLLGVLEPDFLIRPGVADAYPRALIDWYATPEAGWFAREFRANVGDSAAAKLGTLVARATQVVGVLAKADGPLLFGTDTPSDPTYAEPPGYNGRLEIDNWTAAGVSAQKLLRAMTIDNARRLRLDGQIGTIEPGKIAHLLLLRANPLDNVRAYDTIETVFLRGRPVPRAALSARRVQTPGN